jgi:nucleoside-diphosphate-sugar epimerase
LPTHPDGYLPSRFGCTIGWATPSIEALVWLCPRAHAIEFFLEDRAFSIERARVELGYQPRVSIEDAMQQTVEWYLQEGLL